jgi:hypothetical protein
MTFRVHRNVEHRNNTNAFFKLLIEDHVAGVRKPIIAGANVLDAVSHVGHLSELSEATRKPEKVIVCLTLAKPSVRLDVDFGQIPIRGPRELKSGHRE